MRFVVAPVLLFALLLAVQQAHGAVFTALESRSPAVVTHVTRRGDTVFDVARMYDLGALEILRANPGVAHTVLPPGTRLVIPLSLRLPEVQDGIVIDLGALRLFYFPPGGQIYTFPVTVGKEGWYTPTGVTKVVRKKQNPSWTPSAAIRAEDPTLPAIIPAGPDNPLGFFALYLSWPGYALHGTNRPYSIGRRTSHGCIRLYPEDIQTLFELAPVGTKVTIIDSRLPAQN